MGKKVFSLRLEELSIFLFIAVIIGGFSYTYHKQTKTVFSMLKTTSKTIVIDAGHGGFDPGKIGTNGEDEKNINLEIALKLQNYLECGGATVNMTRNTDDALGGKKNDDMKQRKSIANEKDVDILISIHQNSFPKKSAKGAQVFYHKSSNEGKRLAQCIQKSIKKSVDSENKREVKENTDYYILKKTNIPSAIVECGFLSNESEEEKLNQIEYQEKMAWAIYIGIIEYFSTEEEI